MNIPLFLLVLIGNWREYHLAKALAENGHLTALRHTTWLIAGSIAVALVFIGVLSELSAWIVELRVLRPIRGLLRNASRLATGDLDIPVQSTGKPMSEIQTLVAKLDGMAQLLSKLALTDSLTGVANRRQFDSTIADEVKRSTRAKKGLAVLLIDVDKFKGYNDLYGHGAGDLCLTRIAAALQGAVRRPSDLVARYGGEEFVVLLPDTDGTGAHAVASELLSAVRNLAIPHGAWERGIVTISIGLAVSPPPSAVNAAWLIERADRALYGAKREGRDRALMSGSMSFAA